MFLADALNRAILVLPNVLVAAVLLLAGAVIGSAARLSLERSASQMSVSLPLGAIAQWPIIDAFAISAATQVGASTDVLTGFVAILLAGAVGTVAPAFGLGGREAARAVSAGRSLRDTLHVGQVINAPAMRGA